jgi:PIN domain nuclease of toxin-antitoxin system
VLSVVASRGGDPAGVAARLTRAGVLGEAIGVEPSRSPMRSKQRASVRSPLDQGLSLADRAFIALARRLGLPALITDRTWADARRDAELVFIR